MSSGIIRLLLYIAKHAWILGLAAALALGGAIWYEWKNLKPDDPLGRRSVEWLIICFAADLVAVALERFHQWHEQKDANELRTQIARLQTRAMPRQLTEPCKAALRQVLAKYLRQDFRVMVQLRGDEHRDLANQIGNLLAELHWPGNVWPVETPESQQPPPGVGILAGANSDDPHWADAIMRDMEAALVAGGIEMFSGWTPTDPVLRGTIEIWVGKRPSEAESLRRELADQRAPRTLAQAQKEILKSELSKFAGTKYRILVAITNAEGARFAVRLRGCLTDDCGWEGTVVFQDQVLVSPGVRAVRDGTPASGALTEALRRAGVAISSSYSLSTSADEEQQVTLLVGVKPD